MSAAAFIPGAIVGVMLAAPVGPLALVCIHRAVARGSLHGFVSGLGIATADALYAAIVASGLVLLSDLLLTYQMPLRIVAGLLLMFIGCRVFRSPAQGASANGNGNGTLLRDYSSMAALTLANVFTVVSIGIFLSGSGIVIGAASPADGLVFAAGVFAGEVAWWLPVCAAVGSARHRLEPVHLGIINRVSGCIVMAAGIVMIISAAFL